MIIALGACFALVLICFFLRIDVDRAVKAKEEWRSQAIKTDIDRQGLSARVDRLLETLRANNQCYQELSDALEDAELELSETESELENSELQLAFNDEVRTEQEKTISFWIRQFNQAVDERRAVQRERDEFDVRGAALAQERNEFEARCRNIARTLDVSEEDSREGGFLWGRVKALQTDRDTVNFINKSLTTDLFTCAERATKAEAERNEDRKALQELQKSWAVFQHDLGEAIGCGLGAAQTPETLVECVRILRTESVKSAADLVDVTRERDEVRKRLEDSDKVARELANLKEQLRDQEICRVANTVFKSGMDVAGSRRRKVDTKKPQHLKRREELKNNKAAIKRALRGIH